MKRLLLIYLLSLITAHSGTAQVPVTVTRSTINSGGTVALPSLSASQYKSLGVQAQMNLENVSVGGGGTYTLTCTGSGSGSPGSIYGTTATTFSANGTPFCTFATNAPSVFTNSASVASTYYGGGYTGWPGVSSSQTYLITVVEDGGGGGGGGTTLPIATLTGMGDALENLSRRDASIAYRKVLGFQLKASTNAVTSSVTITLANTTANSPPDNNFLGIQLYRDDGSGEWDGSDTLVATTTNANGFAIFEGLSIPVNSTNQTFFAAASFCPTNQNRNSFISASLRSQNIITTLAETNAVIETTGGTVLGKQYAFLDTTAEEDAAAALANQINSAVTGATNALNSAWSQNMDSTTNALNQAWGDRLENNTRDLNATWSQQLANATNGFSSSTIITSSKPELMDTVLPAAISGAVAIGAAFTSDSLGKQPVSREFSPSK